MNAITVVDHVANLRTFPKWREYDHTIYIGREANRLQRSVFANPFAINLRRGMTREKSCERYDAEVLPTLKIQTTLWRLPLDKSFTFVCWCSPLRCHGDSLVRQRAIWRKEQEGRG